jgi:hypothetical protein
VHINKKGSHFTQQKVYKSEIKMFFCSNLWAQQPEIEIKQMTAEHYQE